MRKSILCAVFVMLSVVSCQQQPAVGAAVHPQFDRSAVVQQIVVYVHPDYQDVNDALDKYAREDRPEVYGWSTWYIDGKGRCEIHVIKPDHLHTKPVETWGHELMHCVYGSYHPE
jgi:hypothetical protein